MFATLHALGLNSSEIQAEAAAPATLTQDAETPISPPAPASESSPYKVDPDTNQSFPLELTVSYATKKNHETIMVDSVFYLLGLGVRQVTLLAFNAYVVALYADQGSLAGIKHSKKWASYTPSAFLKGVDSGFHVRDLVRRPGCELTLVIRPVRPTTGAHLRQGVTTLLRNALAKDIKSKSGATTMTPEDLKRHAESAIKDLESKFPVGAVEKGQQLVFTKTADCALRLEFEGRELAVVKSRWLAESFFEGYISHERPICNKLRYRVAEGLQAIPKKKEI